MELDALPFRQDILKYSLFATRRFLPIFLATFLGAFNDNMLRSGLVVLIAYSASKGIALPGRPEILVTVCSALLVLPMLLFSSLAGELADKFEKSRLVLLAKIAELLIMAGAYVGFATNNIPLLMVLLFISGMHTTFYSPIKFSILPDHLQKGELLAANGFMSGGSYLAILFGMIAGGLLVDAPDNVIGMTAVGVAAVGLVASGFILPSKIAHPHAQLSFNLIKGVQGIVVQILRRNELMRGIFAISWFMMISSVYMSQFANYAKGVMQADHEVYILFLTVFSVGIAIGSLVCDTLLKGEISPRLAPFSALGISFFTYAMVLLTPTPSHEGLLGVADFLTMPVHWAVLGSMLMVAMCGGMYMVPLYAMLQSQSKPEFRSRIIAGSNLSDALFMTLAAVVCALLLSLNFSIRDLFLLLATLNIPMAWYATKIRRS